MKIRNCCKTKTCFFPFLYSNINHVYIINVANILFFCCFALNQTKLAANSVLFRRLFRIFKKGCLHIFLRKILRCMSVRIWQENKVLLPPPGCALGDTQRQQKFSRWFASRNRLTTTALNDIRVLVVLGISIGFKPLFTPTSRITVTGL